jgi:endonuclease YncB( thermonuclease family)
MAAGDGNYRIAPVPPLELVAPGSVRALSRTKRMTTAMTRTLVRMATAAVAVAASLTAALTLAPSASAATVYYNPQHTIKSVPYRGAPQIVWQYTDGDTMWVANLGRAYKIRLIGINTPEIYGRVECGGPQAAAYAKRIAPIGWRIRTVHPASEPNTDRYGRLLRYIVLAGRGDFGADMIRTGLAKAYYDGISPHGYRAHPYQATYRQLDARYHYAACPALRS